MEGNKLILFSIVAGFSLFLVFQAGLLSTVIGETAYPVSGEMNCDFQQDGYSFQYSSCTTSEDQVAGGSTFLFVSERGEGPDPNQIYSDMVAKLVDEGYPGVSVTGYNCAGKGGLEICTGTESGAETLSEGFGSTVGRTDSGQWFVYRHEQLFTEVASRIPSERKCGMDLTVESGEGVLVNKSFDGMVELGGNRFEGLTVGCEVDLDQDVWKVWDGDIEVGGFVDGSGSSPSVQPSNPVEEELGFFEFLQVELVDLWNQFVGLLGGGSG